MSMNNNNEQAPTLYPLGPIGITRAYLNLLCATRMKRYLVARALITFLFPVVLPAITLLQGWTLPRSSAVELCSVVLLWANLLILIAQLQSNHRPRLTKSMVYSFNKHKQEQSDALRTHIWFCMLCAIACAILLAPAAVVTALSAQLIAIIGGGYLLGVLSICTLQLPWRLFMVIRSGSKHQYSYHFIDPSRLK